MSPRKKTTHTKRTKSKKELEECCVHDQVMKEIQEKDINMRPKVYFVAGSVLMGIGIAAAAVVSSFFAHVLIYKIRYEHAFEYLVFGRHGFELFMMTFPWVPLLVAGGGLFGGWALLKHYDISYKQDFWKLLIGSLALIVGLGFVIDQTNVPKKVESMKMFKNLYHEDRADKVFLIQGRVVGIENELVVIENEKGDRAVLYVQELPPSLPVKEGSYIRAIGTWDDEFFVVRRMVLR